MRKKKKNTIFQQLQFENKEKWKSLKSRVCTKKRLQKKREKDAKLNVISLWHFETEQTFLTCKKTGRSDKGYVILKQRIITGR